MCSSIGAARVQKPCGLAQTLRETSENGEVPVRVPVMCITLMNICFATSGVSHAQRQVDILAYFEAAQRIGRAGLARKSSLVDARPARPGEVIVTVIAGQGKETHSPPARAGDMVVRNRCPETGNEEYLVSQEKFVGRYDGPIGGTGRDTWRSYRPRGQVRRYIIVAERDGAFTFKAPWGEQMVARPGDAIVQDLKDKTDTYRVAAASFRCSYEVLSKP